MLDARDLKDFAFRDGTERVAYAYLGSEGHVGPIAAREIRSLLDAVAGALTVASQGSSERFPPFCREHVLRPSISRLRL
jgi:hypothetical protein